jgi:hypothetical protein
MLATPTVAKIRIGARISRNEPLRNRTLAELSDAAEHFAAILGRAMVAVAKRFFVAISLLSGVSLSVGCSSGYMKASDLADKKRGPADCAESCHDLGMEMAALVLVSNALPACVCEPVGGKVAPSAGGASGSVGGYVVIAAAAAAAQQQRQQLQQSTYRAPPIH